MSIGTIKFSIFLIYTIFFLKLYWNDIGYYQTSNLNFTRVDHSIQLVATRNDEKEIIFFSYLVGYIGEIQL